MRVASECDSFFCGDVRWTMIEVQCTSCHTRYRIDERVLPDETPTFKCSRCGHVFTAEPPPARRRKSEADDGEAGAKSGPASASAPRAEESSPAPENRDAEEIAPNENAPADQESEELHTPAFVANKSVAAPVADAPRAASAAESARSS